MTDTPTWNSVCGSRVTSWDEAKLWGWIKKI